MDDSVCIPRDRYEFLLKCEKIVDSEFNEDFSKEFISMVKESESEYKTGKFKRFDSIHKAKDYLDSL